MSKQISLTDQEVFFLQRLLVARENELSSMTDENSALVKEVLRNIRKKL